ILISARPNIWRRYAAVSIAEAVILLEQGQRATHGPIRPARGVGRAIDERVHGRILPGLERSALGRHVNRYLIPAITLRQRTRPTLRTLALVNDRDHEPRDRG